MCCDMIFLPYCSPLVSNRLFRIYVFILKNIIHYDAGLFTPLSQSEVKKPRRAQGSPSDLSEPLYACWEPQFSLSNTHTLSHPSLSICVCVSGGVGELLGIVYWLAACPLNSSCHSAWSTAVARDVGHNFLQPAAGWRSFQSSWAACLPQWLQERGRNKTRVGKSSVFTRNPLFH